MLSSFHCRAGLDKPGFCYIILLYGLYTAGKVCRRLHAALFLRGSPAFGPETVLKCAAGACAAGSCAGRTAFLKQLRKIPLLLISCTQLCSSPSSSIRRFFVHAITAKLFDKCVASLRLLWRDFRYHRSLLLSC